MVRSRQEGSITGSIVVRTSDDEKQFNFELEGFDRMSWEEASIMRNRATVVTKISDRRKKHDWSGSREASLVVTIHEGEIEYQRIIS